MSKTKKIKKVAVKKTKVAKKNKVLRPKKTAKRAAPSLKVKTHGKRREENAPEIIFDSKSGNTDALFASAAEQNASPAQPGNPQLDPAINEALKEFDALPKEQQEENAVLPSPLEMNRLEVDLETPLLDGDAEKSQKSDAKNSPGYGAGSQNSPQTAKKKEPWWKKFFPFK